MIELSYRWTCDGVDCEAASEATVVAPDQLRSRVAARYALAAADGWAIEIAGDGEARHYCRSCANKRKGEKDV